VDDIICFAEKKLLCMEASKLVKQPTIPKEALLAVLNVRIPLTISRSGQLSDEMGASYMRTTRSISSTREIKVFGSYTNEPVLAYVSSRISRWYPEHFSPTKMLGVLQEMISLGLIDTGDLGEQLLALIYIMARDACVISASQESHPLLKVEDLLNKLYPNMVSFLKHDENFIANEYLLQYQKHAKEELNANPQMTEEQKEQLPWKILSQCGADVKDIRDNQSSRKLNLDLLLDGQVSFSQFLDIENTPNEKQLEEAFY
jgi:hypothetical protein